MRDVEKTVGTMIDKQKTAFIGSIDSEGFPISKPCCNPEKGRDKNDLSDNEYIRQCVDCRIPEEQSCL